MSSANPAPLGRRLTLRNDKRDSVAVAQAAPWPILVVDDDADVHAMTRVLLRDFSFEGRPFEIISAHSAAEARHILDRRSDIPVALLDVVMETNDAGLSLVRHIREDLGNRRLSIVLRTGQPGEAPERDVMLGYDINDYRTKTELTAQKLFSALIGGLRSWTNLTTIDALNASLETQVAERTAALEQARRFAESLIDMLPNPVWYKDGDGRLTVQNRAFMDMFASEPGESGQVPATLTQLDHQTDAALASAGGGTIALESGLTLMDGPHEVVISKGQVASEADPTRPGSIAVLTDITERKRLEQQLRHLATTDDLTGATSRRAFFAAAEAEVERSARYGGSLAVIMVDFDHFKQINDHHGHATGDACLKAGAAALRANLRDIDVLGRLGGEEFAVLLPATPLAGAVEVAERLRRAIAELRVASASEGPMLVMTASFGVAERLGGETSTDAILARADSALYRSKALGRDRVTA